MQCLVYVYICARFQASPKRKSFENNEEKIWDTWSIHQTLDVDIPWCHFALLKLFFYITSVAVVAPRNGIASSKYFRGKNYEPSFIIGQASMYLVNCTSVYFEGVCSGLSKIYQKHYFVLFFNVHRVKFEYI